MDCAEARAAIDALTPSELEPGRPAGQHLADCPGCQAALALARRVDELLASEPTVVPPPALVAAVMSRIMSERWRSEQHVDRWFNFVMLLAIALIGAGIVLILNLSGLMAIGAEGSRLLLEGVAIALQQSVPSLRVYAAAAGVLAAGGIAWWWAEHTLSL